MLLLLLLWLADPQQATSLLQRGLLAMQKGQTAEARTTLEQASQLDDRNAFVWSSLAEVYLRLNDSRKAASAAEQAEKLGGDNPLVCHALAMYYSHAEQPGRAAPLEQKFAESNRADPAALARAADLFLAAGEIDPAYILAQKALKQKDTPLNQGLLGRILLAKGSLPEATPYLKKAWEANPADASATFDYTDALLRAQAFTEAADALTPALQQHPSDAQLQLLLGVARYGQRRFDDAVTTFLNVIHLDPQIEQPYLFLGRLLEQAGSHLPQIIEADRSWAQRNPRNPKGSLELAKALLQQDHGSTEALNLLHQSIASNDKDWESHYQLGVLLESRHDFPAASAELQKSIALDPKQSMPHYHLARVYDRLGDSAKAAAERATHAELTAGTKDLQR